MSSFWNGVLLTTSLVATAATAQQVQQVTPHDAVSDWGYITWISTGWIEDSLAVITTAPLANPYPACPTTDAGYATNPTDPGHKLHHAALLAAYFSHKLVQIRVDGCIYQKPRIISVSVKD